MRVSRFLSLGIAVLVAAAGCSRPAAIARSGPAIAAPRTQAERTNYLETSTYAQVVAFLDTLERLGRPLRRGSIGTTNEGRALPYVVVSRPLYDTPDAARRSGRPVVYVQGNIHAGEVEGKEALLALVRDLMLEPRRNVLDSIVLIAQPIYNADGNERFAPQTRNRVSQNGPEMVGTRANAQSRDLNRDYVKLEAPETRAAIGMFNTWDPHVFVDLHTTDGSYHGYNLTYAPSLNPAAELPGVTFGGAWAHDSLLPELRRRVKDRHDVATFDYGDFNGGNDSAAVSRGWYTFDHRPRFGTNYHGLRGRIGVLSEAFSHDPFQTRVRATYAFVKELLSLVAERRQAVVGLAQRSDAALRAGNRPSVPVRARMSTNRTDEVVYEELERLADSTARSQPGVRIGMRRTGRYRTLRIPIYDRFTPDLSRPLPWGYAIAAGDTSALQLVRQHGITVTPLAREWAGDAGPQFRADSAVTARGGFGGPSTVRLFGRWADGQRVTLPAGTWLVPTAQPLGILAAYLLEPESDDGIIAWDIGKRSSGGSGTAPVIRLERAIP